MGKSVDMAESFLKRAGHKLDEAREQIKSWNHAESISASQECIELATKAVFLLLNDKYPKRHEFEEDEFEPLLDKIPKEVNYLNFPRLYLFHKLWSNFYTVAKYGYEKFGIGPENIFKKEEAELACKHADESKSAANILFDRVKYPPKT